MPSNSGLAESEGVLTPVRVGLPLFPCRTLCREAQGARSLPAGAGPGSRRAAGAAAGPELPVSPCVEAPLALLPIFIRTRWLGWDVPTSRVFAQRALCQGLRFSLRARRALRGRQTSSRCSASSQHVRERVLRGGRGQHAAPQRSVTVYRLGTSGSDLPSAAPHTRPLLTHDLHKCVTCWCQHGIPTCEFTGGQTSTHLTLRGQSAPGDKAEQLRLLLPNASPRSALGWKPADSSG